MSQQVPTIKEIAKRLNICASTVSRALHDHPSIGLRTKMRVQQLAKELNYEPNQTAIFFQKRKTFTIGVVLPELSEAFFSSAISGIENEAEKNNYTVLMGQSHDSEERERKILETMKNHRVDGLLVSISKNTTNYSHFEALKQYNIPVVFFDRIPNLPDINYVACNMASGTVKAADFLLKKGHRIIGMINGPQKLLASQERVQGYIQAMHKSRLKYDPSLVISCNLTAESIRAAMTELLSYKRKPTAIVAFNDYVVLDAVAYARQQNLIINKDLSFVSFANLPISIYTEFPPLASVEQFPYRQGAKAMETLLTLLSDNNENTGTVIPHNIIIESQLMIHESETNFKPAMIC